MNLLAADVGGTNSRLVLARNDNSRTSIVFEKSYRSGEFNNLNDVIDRFLNESAQQVSIDAACIAVAGPVKAGRASVTNLPWVISEEELSEAFHFQVSTLINDFSAVAYGIPELKADDIITLQQGGGDSEVQKPDFAVIGAGTGLGASHVIWSGDHYRPYPSEAGHAGFAPENQLQCQLTEWLMTSHEHVSLEMVLSGGGIVTIYEFLRDVVGMAQSPVMLEKIKLENQDVANLISEGAISQQDELCQKTLEIFSEIYGSAAGNFVLQHYPLSEIYIAGGIAPKIIPYIQAAPFIDAFNKKGKMANNMSEVAVHLVLQDKVGLYGALARARYLFNRVIS